MAKFNYYFGLKMRMYPNNKQKELIKINSDATRAIYNKMLEIDKEIYQLKQCKIDLNIVVERIEELTLRKKTPRNLSNHYKFLEDPRIDSLTKANAVKNYQTAWKMFRKVHKTGTPNWHKKSNKENYQTNCQYPKIDTASLYIGSVKFIDYHHIQIPKLGVVRVSGSQKRILERKAETRIGTVTIKKDSLNRYYVSLQLASDRPFVKKHQKTNKQIGIDLNLDNFLYASDGTEVPNPRYYRAMKKRLVKQQRVLSRRERRAKKDGRNLRSSKNYQKQRLKVAKIHNKIKQQRRNFLDNLSITLINSHDLVVAEELRSKNLLKNHALAMSISDVGWRMFLNMLSYKAELYGTLFMTVDPKNTTQTCSNCGFVMGTKGTDKLTLKDREWTCPNCKQHHIRDLNASRNILAKGLEKLKKRSKRIDLLL